MNKREFINGTPKFYNRPIPSILILASALQFTLPGCASVDRREESIDAILAKENVLIEKALSEFKQIMNIKADPILIKEKLWLKAIPQYNLGYIEHENYFDKFEKDNPGLFLSGNYRGGISVGDCVKNSELVVKRMQSAE